MVHSGLVHLGFNLLILLWCGTQVERVLGAAGLMVLYVVGAYAAAAAQWGSTRMATVPMIGASGAISAVMGAYALSFGRAKAFTNNLRSIAGSTSLWLLVAWVVLQVMMGWLGNQQGYLLATPAHVGGFAVVCCSSARCCCGGTGTRLGVDGGLLSARVAMPSDSGSSSR